LARLRNRRFFSLAELNVAVRRLVDELSGRRRTNQNPVTKARQRRRWAPQVREGLSRTDTCRLVPHHRSDSPSNAAQITAINKSATTNAMSHLLFDGAHERTFHSVRKALHSYSRAICARGVRRALPAATRPCSKSTHDAGPNITAR
jgi:hypothetical protein